jgi:hypothetical protein
VHRKLLDQIAEAPGVNSDPQLDAALRELLAAIEAGGAESLMRVGSVLETEWQVLAGSAG